MKTTHANRGLEMPRHALAIPRWVSRLTLLWLLLPLWTAQAANISIIWSATYVGDSFFIDYGLGSPAPNKTVYLYINGSQVDSANDTSDKYYFFSPPSAGNYTFDVYYTDSTNGPFSPTWDTTAGTYSVSNPPIPSLSNASVSGTVGGPFTFQIGGNYVSSYDASGLPPGLSVSTSSGNISGSPTTAGTYNATIYASNVSGTGSASLTITINSAVAPNVVVQPVNQSPAPVRALGAGASTSIFLRRDGTVWGVGYNYAGQIGDGTTSVRTRPVPTLGLSGVVAIAVGYLHTLAVTSTGGVLAYGDNGNGQLGDGTSIRRTIPVPVSGLSGVTAVAAGTYHSLALKTDGTVWAWGNNGAGQLGDGTGTSRNTPVRVSGLTGVVAIAAGHSHSLALKGDGTVWAWGYNGTGELGDGTTTLRYAPVQVLGLTSVTSIGIGDYHSIAVRSDGSVWTWGSNGYGQLGDGTTSDRYTPVQVSGFSGAQSAVGGNVESVILKTDGTVWGFGGNFLGELGDGSTTKRTTPVQMSGVTGAIAVACGSSYDTLVLKSDGTVLGCGDNSYSQLGDGTSSSRYSAALAVALNDCVFCLSASGDPAPTYQWQREPAGQSTFSNLSDNATYSGSTASYLRMISPTTAMSGDQFRCVITNNAGSVTSSAATLVVGPPTMTILGGNNQTTSASQFNAQAFDTAVWNAAGSAPLMGAPLTFTVQSGGGMLATTTTGSPTLYSTLTLNTDVDGTAQVFYKQPGTGGVTSQITASSGGAQVTFTTQSASPGTPPSAPAWVHTGTSSPSAVTFSWGSATPYGGASITGYNIYRNGTLLNSVPQLSTNYSDTTVVAGTAYTYTVKAVDSTGAISTAATLNVTAPVSSTSGSFDVLTPTP